MSDILERPAIDTTEAPQEPERRAARFRARRVVTAGCLVCGAVSRYSPGDAVVGCHPFVFPSERAALDWAAAQHSRLCEPAGAVRLP